MHRNNIKHFISLCVTLVGSGDKEVKWLLNMKLEFVENIFIDIETANVATMRTLSAALSN